jgi:hypothetical protein
LSSHHSNILSVSKLIKKKFKIIFQNDICEIRDTNDRTVLPGTLVNGLYVINAEIINNNMKCNYGKVDNNINTWRKRYDHLNITTLKKLYEKKVVNGLKLNDKQTECISCIKAKHKRGSFNSQRTNRATRPRERLFIHSRVV